MIYYNFVKHSLTCVSLLYFYINFKFLLMKNIKFYLYFEKFAKIRKRILFISIPHFERAWQAPPGRRKKRCPSCSVMGSIGDHRSILLFHELTGSCELHLRNLFSSCIKYCPLTRVSSCFPQPTFFISPLAGENSNNLVVRFPAVWTGSGSLDHLLLFSRSAFTVPPRVHTPLPTTSLISHPHPSYA